MKKSILSVYLVLGARLILLNVGLAEASLKSEYFESEEYDFDINWTPKLPDVWVCDYGEIQIEYNKAKYYKCPKTLVKNYRLVKQEDKWNKTVNELFEAGAGGSAWTGLVGGGGGGVRTMVEEVDWERPAETKRPKGFWLDVFGYSLLFILIIGIITSILKSKIEKRKKLNDR